MNAIPIRFLSQLKENNNREWFNENKAVYEEAKGITESFVNALIAGISQFDKSIIGLEAKKAMFRIYRDIRFSKNKTPYKTFFGSYIAPNGRKSISAGYYLHIEPGASFLAGGMHSPQSEHLKKVRQEIFYNIEEFKNILNQKEFKKNFETLGGEKLKRPPNGFPADFEDIELLKHKEFIVIQNLTDKDILSDNFFDYAIAVFKTMKPLNDFLNKALD